MAVTLFLCADDRGGLTFNGRRQSRDRAVMDDLLREAAGRPLWAEEYSLPLFPEGARPRVLPAGQLPPDPEALCFVELRDPAPLLERAGRLVVYRWNRLYPADRRLPLPPAGWRLLSQSDFPGRSHPRITKEVYVP